MTIFEKIAQHRTEKNFVKITRDVGNKIYQISYGYILNYSFDFILLIESDECRLNGYRVYPTASIVKIRNNKFDKFSDMILIEEGHKEFAKIPYQIDLESWKNIFNSIKNINLNCAVENENNKRFFFRIGEIVKVKEKYLQILNFDPAGYLDFEPTKIKYKEISSVSFDDNYTNTMSKYLRIRE